MKGKIAYLAVVEKEIEIPDEIVKIVQKPWFDWRTEEDDEKMSAFSEKAWESVGEDCLDRCGIYYKKDGDWWVLEEY